MKKNDPYAALRFKEFNIFLFVRFARAVPGVLLLGQGWWINVNTVLTR